MGGSSTIGPLTNGGFGEPGIYGTLGTPASGNVPGSRLGAATWTDSGDNLWLFGGDGYDSSDHEGMLDDLWEFNPSTNEWTWMGGSSTINYSGTVGNPGVYGTLGTPAPGNIPGGRASASSWIDNSGRFWLFGGSGYLTTLNFATLNDLWVYQPYTTPPVPPDFSIAASPTSITVMPGSSGSTSVSVTPQNGFNSSVSFSCSGLPAGASCSFSPQTVTLPGTTSTTLTVSTSATTAALHRNSNPLLPEAALAAVLFCFGFRNRRRLQMLLLLAVIVAGLGLFTGCGGGAGSGGQQPIHQPVTTTITVTAQSGSLSHKTTFSLTVN